MFEYPLRVWSAGSQVCQCIMLMGFEINCHEYLFFALFSGRISTVVAAPVYGRAANVGWVIGMCIVARGILPFLFPFYIYWVHVPKLIIYIIYTIYSHVGLCKCDFHHHTRHFRQRRYGKFLYFSKFAEQRLRRTYFLFVYYCKIIIVHAWVYNACAVVVSCVAIGEAERRGSGM